MNREGVGIMMQAKQITVFGANGFIGRHLVRRLAKTGAIIRVPTRHPEQALALKPMGDVGQITALPCSVRSDVSIRDAIGSSDAVINLIGILYENGQDKFQCLHVETAARLARCAKEQGVKQFVQMSALGASHQSMSAYAKSKAAGEQAVQTFFPEATLIRPSIVFGPEDGFFNLFASLALISPVLPLIGGGQTRFQPVYVGDVAEAVIHILQSPDARTRVYELGGPQVYTFESLLRLLLTVIHRHRCFMEIPWTLAKGLAFFLEFMPHPLLTRDQVELLKSDNIVSGLHNTFHDLGIHPAAAEVILPTYLERFRRP